MPPTPPVLGNLTLLFFFQRPPSAPEPVNMHGIYLPDSCSSQMSHIEMHITYRTRVYPISNCSNKTLCAAFCCIILVLGCVCSWGVNSNARKCCILILLVLPIKHLFPKINVFTYCSQTDKLLLFYCIYVSMKIIIKLNEPKPTILWMPHHALMKNFFI